MSTIRKILALGLASTLNASHVEAVDGKDTGYGDIADVQKISDKNFKELTTKGYSVVLVYTSNSTESSRENMDRGLEMFLDVANSHNKDQIQFFRYDTTDKLKDLASASEITVDLEKRFGIRKRPSILIYCNGEQVFKLDGSAPASDELIPKAKSYIEGKVASYRSSCK